MTKRVGKLCCERGRVNRKYCKESHVTAKLHMQLTKEFTTSDPTIIYQPANEAEEALK